MGKAAKEHRKKIQARNNRIKNEKEKFQKIQEAYENIKKNRGF